MALVQWRMSEAQVRFLFTRGSLCLQAAAEGESKAPSQLLLEEYARVKKEIEEMQQVLPPPPVVCLICLHKAIVLR